MTTEHDPRCYQSVGVPDDLPADLCDCRTLRTIDAAQTTEPTWPAEAAETIREGLARPVQGYAARSDRRKERATTRTSEPKYGDLPIGTAVLAWPGSRDGRAVVTTTRSEPWTLPAGDRVVMVEGYPGGIALTHIEVLPAHDDQPAEPDARDVEALGEVIWTTSRADESTISATGANIVARAVLASDWFAAHDAQVRREERERIAQAVSSAFTGDMFEENAMGAAAENEWTWFRWLALEAIARQELGS